MTRDQVSERLDQFSHWGWINDSAHCVAADDLALSSENNIIDQGSGR